MDWRVNKWSGRLESTDGNHYIVPRFEEDEQGVLHAVFIRWDNSEAVPQVFRSRGSFETLEEAMKEQSHDDDDR